MSCIAVNGAAGRMGGALIEAVRDLDVQIAHLYVRPDSPVAGKDVDGAAGLQFEPSTLVKEHAHNKDFDVLIDFSPPESVLRSLDACVEVSCPMVSGTTGFDGDGYKKIERAADKIPLVFAPNMSVGVNLCFQLLKQISRTVGSEADIEIIEMHHRHKRDAPSGTSLHMGEIIAGEMGVDLNQKAVYTRHDRIGERCKGEIGFQTIRGGDVVGEHTAMFALDGERIELTHKASNRLSYARGALRAAAWLIGRSPGLYGMRDVLNL